MMLPEVPESRRAEAVSACCRTLRISVVASL